MSEYDGDIKLSMTLEPKDVKSASKELQKDIKDIFESNAGKELDEKFKKLEMSMSKASSKAQALQEKLAKLEAQRIPTTEYSEIEKQINDASVALAKLQEKMDKFLETGGKTSSTTFKKMQYDAAQLENTIEYAKGELQDLVDTDKAFTLGSETAEYQKTVEQLADVNNEMRILTSRADEASGSVTKVGSTFTTVMNILKGFVSVCDKAGNALTSLAKKLWSIASSAIKNGIQRIGNAIKSLGNSSEGADMSVKKMFWNMMKYGLGIRSLYVLFRKLRSAITEGINNLVQYNGGINQTNAAMSQLMSSLAYLKNAWAAAFSPILSYVAPVLSRLISMIATVVNTIGKLFAALSGKTSFTAAKYKQNDYAAGLSSGGGSKGKSAQEKYEEAQKKAQERYEKQLAKTQEHNAKQLAKAEEKQAKAAKKLADAQEEVNESLAHYDKLNVIAQEDAKDLSMDEFLPDLWEDPELEEVNWEDFLDASGAGDAFAEMFEEVPIDPWLQDLADKIKDIINQLIDPIKKAWDQVKDYVIKSFKDMIKKIWSLIKTVFKDFLKMWNEEATIEMLKTIFEIFGDIFVIIGNIAEGLEEAWKANDTGLHILENIRDCFKIVIDHVKNITEGLKDWSKELDFGPLLQSIERFTDSLKKVADFIGGVLEDIFEHLLKPYFKYVIEDAGPKFIDVFTDFINKVDWDKLRENLDKIWTAVEHLAEAVTEGMVNALGNISQAVANFVNSEEFDTFCDNLANFINSIDAELVETVLTNIGEVIVILVDDLVKFLNNIASSEAFQKFLNMIADWIKNSSPEDIANGIKLVAGAILAFKFTAFVGKGVIACIDFLSKLSLIAAGAEGGMSFAGIGAALTSIATGLALVAGAAADVGAAFEVKRLKDIKDAQESLPTTASDLNGVAHEMNWLEQQMKKVYEYFHPGETLGDYMVVPSDYEKLSNMTVHLDLMGQELENNGQLSEEMAGKIDSAYDILGDNLESVENLTDDQVQAFSELYKEVENYYNQCADSASATEGIDSVSKSFEDMKESLPTEEDGKTGIKPFAQGVTTGVGEAIKNDTSVKESGKYLTQGLKQGAQEEIEADPPGNWFEGIITSVKEFFGIASPSTVFDEMGQYLVQGLQQGVQTLLPTFLEYLKTSLTELLTMFKTTWTELLKNSTEAWTNIKNNITTKFKELKDKMKELGDAMKENLGNLVTSISSLFDKLKNKVSSVVESIKSTISGLVDAVRNAVESIKSALSSISSMVSSAASGVMSRVGSIASSIRVPHLAQGAVIPPNNEFLAVLGDQKKGMNVETPLETMVEAFNKALDARGGNSNNQPIVLQLDGEVLAQAVWDEEEKRYKQRGDWEPLYG